MSTNLEKEERWIEAWSNLIELVGTSWKIECLLPNGQIVDVENCKGWLQDSAFEGYQLEVSAGWVKGKRGILVRRF
jgi:hypothetical protein